MRLKNFSLLLVSIIALVFFVVAAFAFGFKPKDGTTFNLAQLKESFDFVKNFSVAYLKSSYGLMVTGFIFITFAIIIFAVLFLLSCLKLNNRLFNKIFQIIGYFFFVAAVIFLLSGEVLLMTKTVSLSGIKFNDTWSTGRAAGMLAFTTSPALLLLVVPVLFKIKKI